MCLILVDVNHLQYGITIVKQGTYLVLKRLRMHTMQLGVETLRKFLAGLFSP